MTAHAAVDGISKPNRTAARYRAQKHNHGGKGVQIKRKSTNRRKCSKALSIKIKFNKEEMVENEKRYSPGCAAVRESESEVSE